MIHSLNSLNGVIFYRDDIGSLTGVIKGDTRSLDYGSYEGGPCQQTSADLGGSQGSLAQRILGIYI